MVVLTQNALWNGLHKKKKREMKARAKLAKQRAKAKKKGKQMPGGFESDAFESDAELPPKTASTTQPAYTGEGEEGDAGTPLEGIKYGSSFFAIYDGHGGKNCVKYVKKTLHYHIINERTRSLFFLKDESELDEGR